MDILSTLLDVLFLPVYIFVVLTVHEYGHYFAARFFNISVDSFCLGYGREVTSKVDSRGTRWVFKALPICGHVNLSAEKPVSGRTLFNEAPLWQRITVVSAGPLINVIFAFLILFVFFVIFGQPSKQPVIAAIEPGEAAYLAGLQTGDRILAVEGTPVQRYRDIWTHTWHRPGAALDMTVQRDGQVLPITITPALIEYTDAEGIDRSHGRMGVMIGRSVVGLDVLQSIDGVDVRGATGQARREILARLGQPVTLGLKSTDMTTHYYETMLSPDLNRHLRKPESPDYNSFYVGPVAENFYLKRNVTNSLIEAGKQTGTLIGNIARVPFQLFPVDRELVKPWAIVESDGMFLQQKFYEFIYRVALVSIFIGLLNLIPFPGMDGSILLMLVIERVVGAGSPARQRVYKYALLTSLCVLYGALMAANVHDFPRYVQMRIASVGQTES